MLTATHTVYLSGFLTLSCVVGINLHQLLIGLQQTTTSAAPPGGYNMRPSQIITITGTHAIPRLLYVYIQLATTGSFRICT